MDRLEEFIKNNREAFDDVSPPEFNWEHLKQPEAKKTKFRTLRILAAAASVALLMGFFYMNLSINDSNSNIADTEIDKELSELKVYYSSQVNNKYTELKKYNTDPDIENDIKQMDEFLQELEEELEDVPTSKREEVIEAMIQNYHYKMLMLDRVLDQIKKSDKENKDGTINI